MLGNSMQTDLRQTATINPAQLQSLSVLQMDLTELEAYFAKQMEENPVLEEAEDAPEESGFSFRDFPVRSGESTLTALDFAVAADERDTLQAFLRDQLERKRLPEWQLRLAVYLAGLLDERGYLPEEERAAAYQELPYAPALIERTIALLQSLDPAGVAARDLQECLLLQLERMERPCEVAKRIVNGHLSSLAGRFYTALSRKLKCSLGEIEAAAALIRTLDPRPGSAFQSPEPARYIRPDVTVTGSGADLRVTVNDGSLRRFRIDPYYRELYSSSREEEVRTYLREHLQNAEKLFSFVAERHSTLEACVRCIVSVQAPFFSGGGLRPLSLRDVAEAVGVHESTVSRALKGKYLQFQNRLYPFGYFFSRAVAAQDQTTSAANVKEIIRNLVQSEDRASPLSDEQIQERLGTEHQIAISRRTVAKYRTAMGIPPRSERRG